MSFASFLNQSLPRQLRPVELATARYLKWSKSIVQAGPFRGLRYLDHAHCSALAPKIAGTYEKELQPYLPLLLSDQPDAFIDIGAAEGYYAVGAAVLNWSPRIVAFEAEPEARQSLLALMDRNHLDRARIELRGICTPSELDSLLGECKRPAVIMDVEGFEALLLDPLRVPDLARCRLLVEYHDFVLPGVSDEIRRRMSATHKIEVIPQSPRHSDDLVCPDPIVGLFPKAIRRRVLSELRPYSHHGWLWLTPATEAPVH